MIPIRQVVICGLMLGLLAGLAPLASAEERVRADSGAEKTQQQSPVKSWLELQSSGKAASSQPQPLSGPAMDRVHERYLKSFSHPIPPYYKHAQPSGY
ncbi:MAG TPA: DUF3613 domain-containing protein [Methylophilaceae bacterium]|nr:DUF3613 domain-containing protein [Methylophilaceae bacterium]